VTSILEIVYQPCFSHNLLYIRILDADMERKLISYMNQHLNTNLNVNFEDNINSTLNLRADVKPVMRNVENSWSTLPSSLNFDFLVSNLILRFNHSFFSYSESREPLFFGVFELWRVESVSTLSLSLIYFLIWPKTSLSWKTRFLSQTSSFLPSNIFTSSLPSGFVILL
jgi:hypothetical protein